ncbi:MAG: hypothetical protein Kow0025_12770 [Thermodesulfovibrionales bacterium]
MKVAWFSPFSPQRSGISHYSERIARALRGRCEVHLWADCEVDEGLKGEFRVFNYAADPALLSGLDGYDAVVYNMGNNALYHGNIYDAMAARPGVVVLHDYYLSGFFMNHYGKSADVRRLLSECGARGFLQYASAALRYRFTHHVLRRPFAAVEKTNFWFDREVCARARGVVVHSFFARDKLLQGGCRRPVEKINHPYFSDGEAAASGPSADPARAAGGKFVILSIGEATPYKQLDKVILALARDRSLRENSVFYVIGQPFEERIDLGAMVKRHGLGDAVVFLGYQPMEVVYQHLSRADAYIGLRYPTMGETSGGLIRAMEQGKACLVTDIGWYSELPDDCVVKIGAPVDVGELARALSRLAGDAGYRAAVGSNARRHVHEEFSMDLYVERLLAFAGRVCGGGSTPA